MSLDFSPPPNVQGHKLKMVLLLYLNVTFPSLTQYDSPFKRLFHGVGDNEQQSNEKEIIFWHVK